MIKQGEARVLTKNGEVFVNISLELNIKLDGTNVQGFSAGPASSLPKEEKVNWEIPDFAPGKIDFGK